MLKPKDLLLEPDPRNDQMVQDHTTGAWRRMRMDDLHHLMQQLELGPSVPPAIREQFDVARNAFIYSWFEYEFVTLAEARSYAVLEGALRDRTEAAGADTSRARGLKALYEMAFTLKCLDKHDFEVPSPFNQGETISLFEIVRLLRNNVMHGKPHLFPSGSLEMMRACADILSRLFPAAPASGKNKA